MRIEVTSTGPVVSAEDLAALLELDAADIPRLMRDGTLTARHEIGTGEHAGRFRLTFLYRDRRVRLTCTDDGRVVGNVRITDSRPGG